jgi:hypothetical protein
MSDDFDYTPLQALMMAIGFVLLIMAIGCTIPGQYPDGSVVYFDDSGKPYQVCHHGVCRYGGENPCRPVSTQP